jgi:secondary thiamine-phosphate synthase enzyme
LVHSESIEVATKRNREIVDISPLVAKVVSNSTVSEGMALVFSTHTTTGLFINERESGLIQDVDKVLSNLVPPSSTYLHGRVDNNASSHIPAVLLGPSLAVPIESGRLCLGTWQSIFLAERDGPRRRTVLVRVIGE